MAGEREDSIRQRAYEIWHEEGRPEGRHAEHWRQAEGELDSSAGGVHGGQTPAEQEQRPPVSPHPGMPEQG